VNIEFLLPWGAKKGAWAKAFKHSPIAEMVDVYRERIDHFAKAEIVVGENLTGLLAKISDKRGPAIHWICDLPRNRTAKILSSEELAKRLQDVMNRGSPTLRIFIGGPDGWNVDDLQKINPQLAWSFGPMTLTHEMAALIATEQMYRAFSILKGLPYHQGH
jgi:23S rRNA (pseudouridine1915-N3)-methyltransferase